MDGVETGVINPTKEDFVPGRTFGIRGNIRKAIIVKTHEDNALWTWVSTDYEPVWDSIANIIDTCTWLGDIE